MKPLQWAGLILGSGFFIMVAAGSAQAAEGTEDAYRLGEVVVSAPGMGVEAVSTIHAVTAAEIRERGVRTLDEALTLVPGLVIRTANDGTPRIDIRGLRTRHIMLLLDGIPINSTFDGQFDPNSIAVENIAEIKVTTGGSSVLYGEGGNAGVINIITKKGRQGLHGSVGGEISETDAYLGRFTLGGGTSNVDAFASGSYYDRDDFPLSDNFDDTDYESKHQRENSDRKRKNLFGNFGWTPTEMTQVGVSLQYRKDEYGIPAVVNYSPTDPYSKKPKYDRVDDLEGFAAQLAFEQQFSGPFSGRGWIYYNHIKTLENRYDDSSLDSQDASGSSRSDAKTDNYGLNLQFKGDWQMYGVTTLALIAEDSNWDADGFQNVSAGGGGGGGGGGGAVTKESFDEDRDLQVYSAVLQYELQASPKLGLVLGGGWNWQHRDSGNTEDAGTYLAGLHYDLFSSTRVRASVSRKIRFPSIRQLYEANTGDPDLKAEHTLTYEAGVDQALPAATDLSLTCFWIDAKDFIEKNDFTDRFENFEKYRFTGFEVAAENRYVENLVLRASYSYLHNKNRSDGVSVDELQYRPRDKVTLEGRYIFPFGLTVDASLLYVGHQYVLDKTGNEKKRLNDYTVVSSKISQDLFAKRLNVYVGASNLFDEDYEQSYGLPQAGRTLYAGADYRF